LNAKELLMKIVVQPMETTFADRFSRSMIPGPV
jgi:hypothetical protein